MTQPKENRLTVLVVDDNPDVRDSLFQWLRRYNIQALQAANGSDAVKILQREYVDLLVTDLVMPEKEGLETITWVKANKPAVKIFAMSGSGSLLNTSIYLSLAQKLGAHAILQKPFDLEELKGLLNYHFKFACNETNSSE